MKHKVTDRQLVALLATYFGEGPWVTPEYVYGEGHEKAGQPVWRSHTNMGGAIRIMCDRLRDGGFLTEWDDSSLRGKPYYERGNQLTVKGYEAIEERLGKLPKVRSHWTDKTIRFDFNEAVKPDELSERKERRAAREAEIKRLREEEHQQVRAQLRANAERASGERLAKLRKLFSGRGLADNWSDDELLAFAEQVASV